MEKLCPKCLNVNRFWACASRPDGLQAYCVECQRSMKPRYTNAAYMRNRVARLATWRKYSAANRPSILARGRRYHNAHPEKNRAGKATHKADQINACPSWADKKAIVAVYAGANYLSRLTGVQFDVDHVIPLRSNKVCGLHIAENLQYLTHEENIRKGNRF